MKISKLIALACCASLGMTAISGCSGKAEKENTSAENGGKEMNTVIANEDNVKLIGRTHMTDDTLWLALSGTGIDFTYTGKKLDITIVGDGAATAGNIDNCARAAVYVDGERVVDDMIDQSEKSYTVLESTEEKTVSVQVIKLSETAMSTMGIKPLSVGEGGKVEPSAAKAHRIEFIGDSITCGYGVDDEDENHHFSTKTEDVTKAYAYKTAQNLDADYSMFSVSGYGIISGYTDNDAKAESQTIPQYYNSLGFSWNSFAGKEQPQSVDWDFSKYQPEVVVINLGTNDDSYCKSDGDRQEEFSLAYVEFLKQIREKNPEAMIICSVGIMGQRIYPAVEMAKYMYTKETGDENISVLKFDQQDSAADGLAADWHPTEATHEKAAAKLTEEIKTLMGW